MGHYHYDEPPFERYLQKERNLKSAKKELLAQAEKHYGKNKIPRRWRKELKEEVECYSLRNMEILVDETATVFDSIHGYVKHKYQSVAVNVRESLLTVPEEHKQNELGLTNKAFHKCRQYIESCKEWEVLPTYKICRAFEDFDLFITHYDVLLGVIYHDYPYFRFLKYTENPTLVELEQVVEIIGIIQKKFDPDGKA